MAIRRPWAFGFVPGELYRTGGVVPIHHMCKSNDGNSLRDVFEPIGTVNDATVLCLGTMCVDDNVRAHNTYALCLATERDGSPKIGWIHPFDLMFLQ